MRQLSIAFLLLLPFSALAEPWALSEPAAKADEWGYRPAEGAVADMNPPSFTWVPERDAARWELQIASDAEFSEGVIAYQPQWNAFAPPAVLPPGDYAWRYRGVNQDGEASAWSTARRFEVTDAAKPFPKPERADLLSRIPAEHPRLMVRPEEHLQLAALAGYWFIAPEAEAIPVDPKQSGALQITYPPRETGKYSEVMKAMRAEADKLLSADIDTSEPPLYPEGTVVKSEEWRKIWWGNRVHGIKATEAAAKLAFVYWLTGDERYGDRARDILMDVMAWDPEGSTQYRYNDEAAMPLLYWTARAYTWAYDRFSEEDRKKVAEVMRARGNQCHEHLVGRQHLWKPYASHSNRAWHKLLETAIVFHDVIPEAAEWMDHSLTIFYTCYPVWGGPDGGWHEGIAYWLSYIGRFQYGAMAMQQAFGINAYDKPFFSDNGYYALYTMPPHTNAGASADQSTVMTSERIAPLMGQLAAGAGNPHWKWYADQHGVESEKEGWFGFLFAARAAGVAAQSPADLPSSKSFPDTGLAVLNSNLLDGRQNVQVHFKSSPFGTQSHGYNANNAFLLNLNGERALIRSGRRDIYGSPHHSKWMWHTKSDNAILVNGEGQRKHTADAQGRITHFETTPERDVVVGEAGGAYDNLDRWTRSIYFYKPDVIIIHDVLEAPEPSSYQWLLHAEAEFALEGNAASVAAKGGKVHAQWLYPENLAITQTNEFETPPHEWASFKLDEWHLTAETPEKAAKQEFITVISVGETAVEASIAAKDGGHEITVNASGRAITLTLP
jgi:hypothetical protein